MPNKFLVIGSNSFSGAQFIKYLLENDNNVIGVSRSNEINDVYLPVITKITRKNNNDCNLSVIMILLKEANIKK